MLRHIREKLLFLGDAPDRSLESYNVPFSMQLQVVLWRAVTLMWRDRAVLRLCTTFAVEIVKALVVGIAFFDIGSKAVQGQVSFIYMMLQMSALSTMQTMPRLVDERTVMKMETGDRLYSEWAYIVVAYTCSISPFRPQRTCSSCCLRSASADFRSASLVRSTGGSFCSCR